MVTSLYSLGESKAGDIEKVRHLQEFRECSAISTAGEDLLNKNMRTGAMRVEQQRNRVGRRATAGRLTDIRFDFRCRVGGVIYSNRSPNNCD